MLFKAGGAAQHITVPSGYTSLEVYGINDHDDIVGIALKGTSPVLFLYTAASKSFKTLSMRASKGVHATVTRTRATPTSSASSTSPLFTAPTPAGVPVATRSPRSSVMKRDA